MTKFDIDYERSLVRLAPRWLPVVGLICPAPDELPDESRAQRLLGGVAGAPDPDESWYVPLESGILIELEARNRSPGYHVTLVARNCRLHIDGTTDPPLWLPWSINLDGKRYRPESLDHRIFGSVWREAESDWIVELADRLASYPFEAPPGPAVELVSASQVRDLIEAYELAKGKR